MSYSSKYFTAAELTCKCGCGMMPEEKVVSKLDDLRAKLGRSVTLTSCARCAAHNKAEGGADNSYHVKGLAADVACKFGQERFTLVSTAIAMGWRGIGIAKTFVHLDLRDDTQTVFLY